MRRLLWIIGVSALCVLLVVRKPLVAAQPLKTQNIILVMNDGLRWEEVFRGAEALLESAKPGGVKKPAALRQQFDRPTAEARRECFSPFSGRPWPGKGRSSTTRTREASSASRMA